MQLGVVFVVISCLLILPVHSIEVLVLPNGAGNGDESLRIPLNEVCAGVDATTAQRSLGEELEVVYREVETESDRAHPTLISALGYGHSLETPQKFRFVRSDEEILFPEASGSVGLPVPGTLEALKLWGVQGKGLEYQRFSRREVGEPLDVVDDSASDIDSQKENVLRNADDSEFVPLLVFGPDAVPLRTCGELALAWQAAVQSGDVKGHLDQDGSAASSDVDRFHLYVVPASEHWMWPVVRGMHHRLRVGGNPPVLRTTTKTGTWWGGSSEQEGPVEPGPSLELEIVSTSPRVFYVPNFLTPSECDFIMETAEEKMTPSGLYYADQDKHRDESIRSSEQTWLSDSVDPRILAISERVAYLTKIPLERSEFMQVLRYLPGQKYHSHYDYFPPWNYGNQTEWVTGLNRLATVFYYLNDVEEGGGTVFPLSLNVEDRHTLRTIDYTDCSKGLVVKPKRGDAVLWYHLVAGNHMHAINPSHFDTFSLHGGCPVTKGVKWAANKWIRNKERYSPDDE